MCVFNKIILLVLGSWLFCVNAFTAQRPYDSHPEARVYEAELKLFYEAIKFGHVELVRTFLQISSGEKVDIFTGSILPHLGTVLHMAALHCQTEIVKILLDVVSARGQNRVVYIMAGDLDGYTALHRVVLFGVQFNESKNAKVQDIHAYARQHTPRACP